MRAGVLLLFPLAVCLAAQILPAQSPYETSAAFARFALRIRALPESKKSRKRSQLAPSEGTGRYPWRTNIVTTVFWIGEEPTENNPVPNTRSSWDINWVRNYGGVDSPEPASRKNYIPLAFTPRENPFYCALPYNDVTQERTKPEVPLVVPWFKTAFSQERRSICKGRWIAIRKGTRICYAQWEDCGPFRTDHWQYVFGNERPKPNLNHGAGLDVSPAIRDFLQLGSTDVTDWQFVEVADVPPGPWRALGANNHFVIARRQSDGRFVQENTTAR